MFRDKALRCDCGYEVRACDEDAVVEEVRRHAWDAHGIEFTVELALEVVRKARLELEHHGVTGKEKQ
jgi:predicted small metal-binding protein